MTERLLQPGSPGEPTGRSGPLFAAEETGPDILGFPAEDDGDDEDDEGESPPEGLGHQGPGAAPQLAVLRRSDRVGGAALTMAGLAAAMALWLPWRGARGATGFSLARRGVVVFRSGIGELGDSGLWQPLAVLLGGGLLLALGLLLFFRARSHRLVGVVALLIAVAAATAVLVPLAAADWRPAGFGPGTWAAAAVAAFGVIGALKAMLTAPLVRISPGRQGRTRLGLRMSVLRAP